MKVGLWVLILCCTACMNIPEGVRQSLALAGENRGELKKVLRYYHRRDTDSLKFKAACFLIEQMRWHASMQRIVHLDPALEKFRVWTDSTYYNLVKGRTEEEMWTEEFRRQWESGAKVIQDSIAGYSFGVPEVEEGIFPDLCTIGSEFLTSHIDNAFRVWQESPFARRLSFDEFCEFLLPYRSIYGFSFHESGEKLNRIYGKYICGRKEGHIRDYVGRYNRVIGQERAMQGVCPLEEMLGWYDLFFQGKHLCPDIAEYGCTIMRACGIPLMVEFNAAYRDIPAKHFFCAFPDSTGEWVTFNPESSLPGDGEWSFAVTLNVYRYYFSAQKDTPYFLRREGEYLPGFMGNPCIRDVTSHLLEVKQLVLPFREHTVNHLAYLAVFQKNEEGLVPVTWGTVDQEKQQVAFKNCLLNVLYFPVYYEGRKIRTFGEPFYLMKDPDAANGIRICYSEESTPVKGDLILTRKYPRKPNMIQLAEKLVGSRFLASDRADMSDARTLYTITKAPEPYLQDFPLSNRKAYQYYQFIAPEEHPHANVAMLEFLTGKHYGYTNTLPPTPLPVLFPGDTLDHQCDVHRVKLLDAPSWEEMKWKAEYDGNMQTAPGAYKTVNLNLKEPQVVTRIRFAPKNADNGVKPGDRFELKYWDRTGWKSLGTRMARYNHVVYKNVPLHRLYWLHNLEHGQEELPFMIWDGQQRFIYNDIKFETENFR